MKKLLFILPLLLLVLQSCGNDDDNTSPSVFDGTWIVENEEYEIDFYYSLIASVNRTTLITRDSSDLKVGELFTVTYVIDPFFGGVIDSVVSNTYTVQDVVSRVTFSSNGTYSGSVNGSVLYIRSELDGEIQSEQTLNAPSQELSSGSFQVINNVLQVDSSNLFPLTRYNFSVVDQNTINLSYSLDTTYTFNTGFGNETFSGRQVYNATLRREQ